MEEFWGSAKAWAAGIAVSTLLAGLLHVLARVLGKPKILATDGEAGIKEEVMEKNIAIGHEANVAIKFENLVANISVSYKGQDGMEAQLILKLPAQVYLEKLKKLIPGNVDDVIIDLAEKAAPLAGM